MFPSVVRVSLFVAATLLVGCASSDDDDGGGAEPPTTDLADGGAVDGDADSSASPDDDDSAARPDPLITFDTQEVLLEEVFAIYAGEAWDRTPLSLPEFGPLFEFQEVKEASETDEGVSASVGPALCSSGGGELSLAVPSGRGNHGWRARLDACVPQDPEATGLALIGGSVSGDWNWHTSARSDDLAWTRTSGERVSFTGEMRTIPDEFGYGRVQSFVTADAHQRVLGDDGEAPLLAIEQATSTLRGGTYGPVDVAGMSGGFTYRSALTGGRSITVRTPLAFDYYWDKRAPAPDGIAPETLGEPPLGDVLSGENRSDEQSAAVERVRRRWAFVTGMLELEAEDGSRVTLDADTGDLDTVRITLDAGRDDGAEERLVEWPGRWFRVLAPYTLPSERTEERG